MGNSALKMMEKTLKASGPLPETFHEVAFTLASKAKDLDVLALLAARPDAPKSLLEKYRLDKRPGVRVAYLTRPDLSEATLIAELASESRAGVLSEVLKASPSNTVLRSSVEKVFLSKPTKALAKVLIDSADPEVQLKCVLLLDGSALTIGQSNDCLKVAKNLSLSEATVDRLVEGARTGTWLEPVLESPHVSDASLCKAIKLVASSILDTYGYQSRRVWEGFVKKLDKILSSDPALEVIEAVTKLRERDLRIDTAGAFEEMLASKGLIAFEGEPDLSSKAGALSAASHCSDPAVLSVLVDKVTRAYEPEISARLLMNPALPAKKALFVLENAHGGYSTVSLARMAQIHSRSLNVVNAAYRRAAQPMLKEYGLSLYPNREVGSRELVSMAAALWSDTSKNTHYMHTEGQALLFHITNCEDVELDSVFDLIPWRMISSASSWLSFDRLLARLAFYETEVFGDNFAAWETFATLAEGFEGSVSDLLSAAKELA